MAPLGEGVAPLAGGVVAGSDVGVGVGLGVGAGVGDGVGLDVGVDVVGVPGVPGAGVGDGVGLAVGSAGTLLGEGVGAAAQHIQRRIPDRQIRRRECEGEPVGEGVGEGVGEDVGEGVGEGVSAQRQRWIPDDADAQTHIQGGHVGRQSSRGA